MNFQKKIGEIPLDPAVSGPAPTTRLQRWMGRMVGAKAQDAIARRIGLVQESIIDSIVNSYWISEKMSKDQDTTEKTAGDRLGKIGKIRKMYKGEATWGNIPCASVINFNKTFQWANGLIVVKSENYEEGNETLQMVQDFIDYNDLNEEMGLLLAAEGELSGQVLLRWSWDDNDKHVKIYVVPLLETKYQVRYVDDDYTTIDHVVLHPGEEGQDKIPGEECVFIKFRGTINGSYGVSTVMPCVDHCEDIDKARADLRKINHLFAAPTPVFRMKDADRVNKMDTLIKAQNWKIGQGLVLLEGEEAAFMEIGTDGSDLLIKEIQLLMQEVSAVTDVPVHFLGYPDLLSNRSTSESMFEAPIKRAMAEQRTWMGGFEELLEKILPLYTVNRKESRVYIPDSVSIVFPPVRTGNLADIIGAWLPARVSKQVSHRTFLKEIGIEEPDRELEQIAQEAESEVRQQPRAPTQEEEDEINAAIEEAAESEAA